MGLGKTLTTLLVLYNHNIGCVSTQKYLVLSPKSNIRHFPNQYADHFSNNGFISNIYIVEDRDGESSIEDFNKTGGMLVMTLERYCNIVKDRLNYLPILQSSNIVIVDEAHAIKENNSRFDAILELKDNIKIFITGTPLQNNISELYSLIKLIEPNHYYISKIGDSFKNLFERYFSENKNTRDVLIRSYLFYQYFKDCIHREVDAKELKELDDKKKDYILEYEMTPDEKLIYDKIRAIYKNHQKSFFASYVYERVCLDCPELLRDLPKLNDSEDVSTSLMTDNGQFEKADTSFSSLIKNFIDDNFNKKPFKNSRLELLRSIVSSIVLRGEKVVIFTGFVCYMNNILDMLSKDLNISKDVFTGSSTSSDRSRVIEDLKSGKINTLIVSKNTGGVGIDLTAAQNVILFNLDFNYSKDDQAIYRLVRKNQRNKVKIYRLVCRESVDERIVEIQANKMVVFSMLMDENASYFRRERSNIISEDMSTEVFSTAVPPPRVRGFLKSIEPFKLTEKAKELTQEEIKSHKDNLEREISKQLNRRR
jgi:SNF2 family DNA or RNA helicase